MKILLTGATGFIGRAFCRQAVERGHEIVALVRSERPSRPGVSSPGVQQVLGSLAEPPWQEIERLSPEACVHCAWIATPGVYLESPENAVFLEQSRNFFLNAFQRGMRRVLALGSCAEYAFTGQPLHECDPVDPRSAYARCKNQLRVWLEEESQRRGASACWARVFYPYGPGEHPGRFPSWVIQQLLRSEPVVLKTPSSMKDSVFIEDLVEAMILLLERGASGSVNIGSGEGVTVNSLAHLIGTLMDRESFIQVPAQTSVDPFPHLVAEVSRLRSFGWIPRINLEEGLGKLIALCPA